jgi:hypothetical protein
MVRLFDLSFGVPTVVGFPAVACVAVELKVSAVTDNPALAVVLLLLSPCSCCCPAFAVALLLLLPCFCCCPALAVALLLLSPLFTDPTGRDGVKKY